jgi:hypothetical protein
MTFSAKQKKAEALRELGYRRKVYTRLVAEGRMKGHDADIRLQIMAEIADDYSREADIEEAKGRFL